MFKRLASFLLIPAISIAVSSCGRSEPQRPMTENVSASDRPYDPVSQGRAHYVRFCASCHGADGRGAGHVADALKDPPTDITRLRSEAAGVFDVDDLIEVIRGLKDVRAHGTREMPVWGNIWADSDLQPTSPEQVETRINELVEYIRSIQE